MPLPPSSWQASTGSKIRSIPLPEGYGPYDFNLYSLSDEDKKKIKSLPHTLEEAIDELEKDHGFLTEGGVFPERLIEIWIANKRADNMRHVQMPTPLEFEMYYDL